MKFACAFILCGFLPFFVWGDADSLKDGPCPPHPDPIHVPFEENADPDAEGAHKYAIIWYDVASNGEFDDDLHEETETGKKCAKHNFTMSGTTLFQDTTYEDKDGTTHNVLRKWLLAEGRHGVAETFRRNADGEWENDKWSYSLLANEDGSILAYACKEVGERHKTLYYIRSNSRSPSEETVNKLMQMAKDNGDEREFVAANYENCHHMD